MRVDVGVLVGVEEESHVSVSSAESELEHSSSGSVTAGVESHVAWSYKLASPLVVLVPAVMNCGDVFSVTESGYADDLIKSDGMASTVEVPMRMEETRIEVNFILDASFFQV